MTSTTDNKVSETKSSPLLDKGERQRAIDDAHSLDSKKMNDGILIIDVECICKCLAHAILKHIEFSNGKTLVDDLVPESQDIPEFSYEFGKELKIDIEEIKRRKAEEEYQKYQQKMENYLKLQDMMRTGDPTPYDNDYLYEDEEQYMVSAVYYFRMKCQRT